MTANADGCVQAHTFKRQSLSSKMMTKGAGGNRRERLKGLKAAGDEFGNPQSMPDLSKMRGVNGGKRKKKR